NQSLAKQALLRLGDREADLEAVFRLERNDALGHVRGLLDDPGCKRIGIAQALVAIARLQRGFEQAGQSHDQRADLVERDADRGRHARDRDALDAWWHGVSTRGADPIIEAHRTVCEVLK